MSGPEMPQRRSRPVTPMARPCTPRVRPHRAPRRRKHPRTPKEKSGLGSSVQPGKGSGLLLPFSFLVKVGSHGCVHCP